jgi:hypothetical protein
MTDVLVGDEALQRRFAALKSGKANKLILGQFGQLAVQFAKAKVPRKTGNLGRTIRVGPVSVDAQSVQVLAGGSREVGYAAYVEFGTGPHLIVPVNAKVLAWGGNRRLSGNLRSGAGATGFAMRVNHPGSKAKPYLVPGAEEALERVGLANAVIQTWNEAA